MEFTIHHDFFDFMNTIKNSSQQEQFMYLSIFIDTDDEDFKQLYLNAAKNHNKKILEDPHFYDAGFDLFLPKNSNDVNNWGDGTRFYSTSWKNVAFPVNKIDFKVKCCAKMYNGSKSYFTPFYTYARSSISKTPLMLANHIGIIDSGYRGHLTGMFDVVNIDTTDNDSNLEADFWGRKFDRYVQICAPGLVPILVQVVNTFEELGGETARGGGGFGSTGR